MGGAELLIEKIARHLISINEKVMILTSVTNESFLSRVSDLNVKIIKNLYSKKEIKKLDFNSNDKIITFSFETFSALNYSVKKTVKISNYVITSNELLVGKNINNKLFKRMIISTYGHYIFGLSLKNQMIYMDKESIKLTADFYNIKLINKFVLLPYEIKKFDLDIIKKRIDARKNTFELLTISRADLRIKGYLLDLISGFEKFDSKHENCHLTIITFGQDMDKIVEQINHLPEKTKKNITLVGETKYENIFDYLKNCSIYVGMGTTILDASNAFCIAIPVAAYSNCFLSEGFFSNNPQSFVSDLKNSFNGYDLVEKVYNLSDDDYLLYMNKGYNALVENYNINLTVDKIIHLLDQSSRKKAIFINMFERKRFNKVLKEFKNDCKM
jgi:hypothetical protein